MTTYIGSNTVQHKCDWHEGCNNVTSVRHYANFSLEQDDFFRRVEHWYISMGGNQTYCEKHNPHIHSDIWIK